MKEDLIYLTSANESVLANAIIPLTTLTRKRGCGISSNNNIITLNKTGYYLVNASVSCNASATGNAEITMLKNGNALTGMNATETISATTQTSTLNINGIVRVYCGETATLSLENTGIALTITNASVNVVYLG